MTVVTACRFPIHRFGRQKSLADHHTRRGIKYVTVAATLSLGSRSPRPHYASARSP